MTVLIGNREVGDGHPSFIVAEVAQAHDGSLGAAHAFVDAVRRAGADAVKFQTHLAEAESTPIEPFRVATWRQDTTRYAYWKRTEFTEPQWQELAAHARAVGLVFLSSPFSLAALDLLERIGMPAWKVASGEVTNLPLLRRMAATGRPVMISTGLVSWPELDEAISLVRAQGASPVVLQCTTAYPCPPERLGLNVLAELRRRYRCPIGLSDHSAKVAAGIAAVTLGASVLEVHVTLSRESFGPDVAASLTTAELRHLVDGVRFVEAALSRPVDKEREVVNTMDLRRIFGKSIVAARDLPQGHRICDADVQLKKPGTGIPPARLGEVVGRTLQRAVRENTLLSEADLG